MLYWAERYAWTRDEKDAKRPYKPLIAGRLAVDPLTLRVGELDDGPDDYLRILTLLWAQEQLNAWPKSRQLRLSWLAVGLYTWLAEFRPAQRVAFQSKQLEDADKLIDRAQVILELQEKVAPFLPWPSWKKNYGLLTIFHAGGKMALSRIEALAQGGDKIRGEAYSGILQDESAFQVYAEESHAAIMPLIDDGADVKLTYVSSAAADTFFERLTLDTI